LLQRNQFARVEKLLFRELPLWPVVHVWCVKRSACALGLVSETNDSLPPTDPAVSLTELAGAHAIHAEGLVEGEEEEEEGGRGGVA
jgi:hypothetical protein